MSFHRPKASADPKVLSGPFGSLLNDLHGISTKDAFGKEKFQWILGALHAYKESGVTQPVTPTFGAGPRGVDGGTFSEEQFHWNVSAVELTRKVFGDNAEIFGSIAPMLDTSGHDDQRWRSRGDQMGRSLRGHIDQMEALHDAGVFGILAEAVHDYNEALGIVIGAQRAGMKRVIVSFEPTREGVPNNNYGIESYDEVADRLRTASKGRVDVGTALNCGNADQIMAILGASKPGTFTAIYPNKAAIPAGHEGDRFRELADKNEARTTPENEEFARLRTVFDVSAAQVHKLITLCGLKDVPYVGLCCGSSPMDVRAINRELANGSYRAHLSDRRESPAEISSQFAPIIS